MKLILSILFSTLAFALFSQEQASNPLDFKVLFESNGNPQVSCYRIPALVTAPNGDVIAAIDERVLSCGDLKWNRDINIVIRRSIDNGKTWSSMEKVVDYPLGESASDPSMIVDKVTGAIFMFFNYMNLDNEKDVYYLKVIKSLDNGKTWSEPIDITTQISKREWHNDFKFITSGRGIQTKAGMLLHTLVNLQKGVFVFGSKDHGETWFVTDVQITPADESKIIELANGSWMVNSRVNKKGFRYVHTSLDEGKTWTSKPDTLLIDPSCNASIIRYNLVKKGDVQNMLLFSNANMMDDRMNMTIRVSYDEGLTWTEGKTIYAGSAAYSSMTVLNNGHIGLFFEKDDYQENVFVSIPLDVLTYAKEE